MMGLVESSKNCRCLGWVGFKIFGLGWVSKLDLRPTVHLLPLCRSDVTNSRYLHVFFSTK